jgi:hypothetical protein
MILFTFRIMNIMVHESEGKERWRWREMMLPIILVGGTRLVSVMRRQWRHGWVFPSLAVPL